MNPQNYGVFAGRFAPQTCERLFVQSTVSMPGSNPRRRKLLMGFNIRVEFVQMSAHILGRELPTQKTFNTWEKHSTPCRGIWNCITKRSSSSRLTKSFVLRRHILPIRSRTARFYSSAFGRAFRRETAMSRVFPASKTCIRSQFSRTQEHVDAVEHAAEVAGFRLRAAHFMRHTAEY